MNPTMNLVDLIADLAGQSDRLNKAKDVANKYNTSNKTSIKNKADKYILNFPLLASTSLSISTVQSLKNRLELERAQEFVLILNNQIQEIEDVKAKEFLPNLHKNYNLTDSYDLSNLNGSQLKEIQENASLTYDQMINKSSVNSFSYPKDYLSFNEGHRGELELKLRGASENEAKKQEEIVKAYNDNNLSVEDKLPQDMASKLAALTDELDKTEPYQKQRHTDKTVEPPVVKQADPSMFSGKRKEQKNELRGKIDLEKVAHPKSKNAYQHMAYANSYDGKKGFSFNNSDDKQFYGFQFTFNSKPSKDPSEYTWLPKTAIINKVEKVNVSPKDLSGEAKWTGRDEKRLNMSLPTFVTAKLKLSGNNNEYVTTKFGVKVNTHGVSSDDIIYYLTDSSKRSNFLSRIVRFTSGELSIFNDLILDKDRATRILKSRKANARIWKNINTIYNTGLLKTFAGKKNSEIPTISMVVTVEEVENIRLKTGINILTNRNAMAKLYKQFMLVDFMVIDEGTNILYKYMENVKDFEKYRLSDMLNADLSDNEKSKLLDTDLMKMINR